jgi:D-cysteine desulfhydrase
MNLSQFSRRRYTEYKTPIELLPNFSRELNGPDIYIKRDDLLGLTLGGNKTRKLEFLMDDALRQGADTILTCGAVQSNHCRLTLSAAVKEGLKCRLILEERVPNSYKPEAGGNNFIYRLLGVEDIRVVKGGSDMMQELEKLAAELRSEGRKPYIIPGGGSNEIGALGYVACAEEIAGQLFDSGTAIDRIVIASGSAGTHAGMLTGIKGNNLNIPLIGISVSRKHDEQVEKVLDLTRRLSEKLQSAEEIEREDVIVYDQYVGEGYSLPTSSMIEAVKLLAQTEGIVLDPVYTGKAMAGLVDLVRKGTFAKEEKILFLHTGGSPALFAYTDVFFPEL